MVLPDVNVLIYAFRQDASLHEKSRRWLAGAIEGDAQFGVSPLALAAVVRIVTNSRSFKQPTPLERALAFCDNLLGQPNCEVVEPGPRHWTIFKHLCVEVALRGPPVTDAWYAALAIEHGCSFITFDRDFARFPGLDWRAPD